MVKKVRKITEYSVTRRPIFSWATARARRANASFFRNLFPPHEIFSPTTVRPERTHSSCSLVEKLCAPGKGWTGPHGDMALCSCSIYRLLLYTPVACNKTKPLQSPRRFDRVVLSRSAPSFCLSWKLLLDRSLLSKQKGSSESCQWYIDRRGSRRPMQNL